MMKPKTRMKNRAEDCGSRFCGKADAAFTAERGGVDGLT